MAITAYLDIDQGSDFTAIMELENNDGTPMDLRGYSVYSQFRKSYGSTNAYTFNTSVVDALAGKISLTLTGTASSSIRPGRYLYDVEIVSDPAVDVAAGNTTVDDAVLLLPVLGADLWI